GLRSGRSDQTPVAADPSAHVALERLSRNQLCLKLQADATAGLELSRFDGVGTAKVGQFKSTATKPSESAHTTIRLKTYVTSAPAASSVDLDRVEWRLS